MAKTNFVFNFHFLAEETVLYWQNSNPQVANLEKFYSSMDYDDVAIFALLQILYFLFSQKAMTVETR